jgi:hypothetical protein
MSILTNNGYGIRPSLPASPWLFGPGGGRLAAICAASLDFRAGTQNALQTVLHVLQRRRAARYDKPKVCAACASSGLLCQHCGVKRGACR